MNSFKTRRRKSKYKQILKNDFDIDTSEEPTKNIMIGNAGLVSGIQFEQLAQLFTQYGKVENLVTIPGKSYSFIVYSSVEDAVVAFNAVNGLKKLDNMDGPLYLIYTLSVPSNNEEPAAIFFLLPVLVPSSSEDPTPKSFPDGLTLLLDFVTEEEELKLLNCVDWNITAQELGKTLKNRRVKHFGYEFRYDNNNVDKDSPLDEPIPEECSFIPKRLGEHGHPLQWAPDQLTVNQYQKGQGIPSHIDTHSAFESPLLSLSLGSDVVMEFKRGTVHVPVLLPRRSMLIMDGEARYAWTHGITPRTMDVVRVVGGLTVRERGVRTSFTLRRVRRGPCACDYPLSCDSQQSAPQAISDSLAGQLEAVYVHQVYNNIASHFSETRVKVWPNVEQFLMSFSEGSVVVDAGCGNGKYFGVNPALFQVGFDRSDSLAEITRSRGNEVFVSDCLSLPLRDGVADGIISVAVLHHLSTVTRRVQALREMCRVLSVVGRALVTVWAKDQTKQNKTAYLKQDRKNRREGGNDQSAKWRNSDECADKVCALPKAKHSDNCSLTSDEFKLPIHTARTEFQHQDVFVPWKVKNKNSREDKEVFLRYYHVFEEHELAHLCKEVEGIRVLETYYTEGNWCVIFEKQKMADSNDCK